MVHFVVFCGTSLGGAKENLAHKRVIVVRVL